MKLIIKLIIIIFISPVLAQITPEIEWIEHYSGTCGRSIVQNESNEYVIAGIIDGDQYSGDVYVTKIDSLGEFIWDYCLNSGNEYDNATSIKYFDGSYYVFGTYMNHLFTMTLNESGDSTLFESYDEIDCNMSMSMDINETGNIALCGYSVAAYTILTDTSLEMIDYFWHEFPNFDSGTCCDTKILPNNDIVITGSTSFHLHPNHYWGESYIKKTDYYGNELLYVNFDSSHIIKFVITHDNCFLVIADTHVMKIDDSGEILWDILIPHRGKAIIKDNLDYYIAGNTGIIQGDPFLTKVNDSGEVTWTQVYETETQDIVFDLIQTNDDGFAMTGKANFDMFLMKLNSDGVSGVVSDEIVACPQISIYPNPFNPMTTINYTLIKNSNVSLEVHNLKGQLIKILLNENQVKGEYSVKWLGDNFRDEYVSSGLYFVTLTLDNDVKTFKKCLLLK